jgi:hypothetical protein
VDGVEKGTEVSFFTGLEFATAFIKNLFTSQGNVSGQAFKSFERKVQASLAANMASLFSTGLDAQTSTFAGKGDVLASVQIAKQAQTELFAALLGRVSEADRAAASDVLAGASASLTSALDVNLSAASSRVLQELGTVVVTASSTGGDVAARPAIRGELSHTLAMGLVALAQRPGVDTATRGAAIDRLLQDMANADRFAPTQKVEVLKEGSKVKVLASEVRSQALAGLVASLQAEFKALDKKVKANRYLSADERASHEFLAGALQAIGSSSEEAL